MKGLLRSKRFVLGALAALVLTTLGIAGALQSRDAAAQVANVPDHYLSYSIASRDSGNLPLNVELRDQFAARKYEVRSPYRLMNPTRKNNDGVENAKLHYEAYRIYMTEGQENVPSFDNLFVLNQFGGFLVKTGRAHNILVPTAKEIRDTPDPLTDPYNHYVCYSIKTKAIYPQPPLGQHLGSPIVSVEDQFLQGKRMQVLRPVWLCNPAAKLRDNGEVSDIVDRDNHLMCFAIDEALGEPEHERVGRIYIENQFERNRLRTKDHEELCAPSRKLHPHSDLGFDLAQAELSAQ